MSAELPIFDWYGDRREFLHGSVRLVVSGLIYEAAAPLLAACGQLDGTPKVAGQEILDIPDRKFSIVFIPWKSGQELEERAVLAGKIVEVRWDKQRQVQRLFISDILGSSSREVNLPIELSLDRGVVVVGRALAFSPDGGELAVGVRSGSGRNNVQHVFLVDTQDLSVRKIHEGPSDVEGNLLWSHGGKRLLISSYPHAFREPPYRGAVSVFDFERERVVYSESGAVTDGFSPDGKWVVTSKGYINHQGRPVNPYGLPLSFDPSFPDSKLINIDTGKSFGFLFQGNLEWSKDGRYLAATKLPIAALSGGGYFELPGVTFIDLETGYEDYLTSLDLPTGGKWEHAAPIAFLPDNRTLLLLVKQTDSREHIVSWRLGTSEAIVLFSTQSIEHPGTVSYSLVSPAELLVTEENSARGNMEVRLINLNSGTVTPQYKIQAKDAYVIRAGLSGTSYLQHDYSGESTRFYHYSVKDGRSTLLGRADFYPPLTNFEFWARHEESENNFDFGPGDILVGPGGRGWYLQNGGRYEIPGRVEDFVQRRHKNMKAYEVPAWVLDKISVKEMPSRFFEDQHGRMIDSWSDRLIVVWGGLGSTSKSVMEDHGPFYQLLLEYGWKENQVLFGTCNMRVVRDTFFPELYDRNHSLRYPPTNINEGKNFYSWLKTKAPLLQVTSYGHSQGGVICFYAGGLSHPDMHCQIVTVNAPLVGVDRAVVSVGPFEFEDLSFFKGCESWPVDDWCEALRHYVAEGESSTLRENVENWAKLIENNGVELVNFSARQDPLVGTDRAILKNSTSSINGREIQRVWDIPGALIGNRSPHGRILNHKPFLSEAIKFVGRP